MDFPHNMSIGTDPCWPPPGGGGSNRAKGSGAASKGPNNDKAGLEGGARSQVREKAPDVWGGSIRAEERHRGPPGHR